MKYNPQNLSAGLTLMIGIICITPLCGWMFDCGCAWPWAGMDLHCNIHDKSQRNQCPWCVSMVLGGLFAGIPLVISSIFAWSLGRYCLRYQFVDVGVLKSSAEYGCRIISINLMLSLIVFFVLSMFSGWLAADIRGYPYFILKNMQLF